MSSNTIGTPLLNLCWAIFDRAMAELTAEKSTELRTLSFAEALSKVLSGQLAHSPKAEKAVARLLKAFQCCPLYAQHEITALADDCGCRERLEELIGPLPVPQEPPRCRVKEPMF
jgi:hypothetical protein